MSADASSAPLETSPPPDPSVLGEHDRVSATVPDWSREAKALFAWAPSRSLLASIRAYQRHAGRRNPLSWLLKKLAVVRHRFWSVVTGSDIPVNTKIGGGLLLPHPNGIVIHPECRIGPNCLILQQVTLGSARGGVPTIGGHVDIGAGAKVLGRIRLHDHAVIGANAVVLSDVPPGVTAVGIPARAVLSRQRAGAHNPARAPNHEPSASRDSEQPTCRS